MKNKYKCKNQAQFSLKMVRKKKRKSKHNLEQQVRKNEKTRPSKHRISLEEIKMYFKTKKTFTYIMYYSFERTKTYRVK